VRVIPALRGVVYRRLFRNALTITMMSAYDRQLQEARQVLAFH